MDIEVLLWRGTLSSLGALHIGGISFFLGVAYKVQNTWQAWQGRAGVDPERSGNFGKIVYCLSMFWGMGAKGGPK